MLTYWVIVVLVDALVYVDVAKVLGRAGRRLSELHADASQENYVSDPYHACNVRLNACAGSDILIRHAEMCEPVLVI